MPPRTYTLQPYLLSGAPCQSIPAISTDTASLLGLVIGSGTGFPFCDYGKPGGHLDGLIRGSMRIGGDARIAQSTGKEAKETKVETAEKGSSAGIIQEPQDPAKPTLDVHRPGFFRLVPALRVGVQNTDMLTVSGVLVRPQENGPTVCRVLMSPCLRALPRPTHHLTLSHKFHNKPQRKWRIVWYFCTCNICQVSTKPRSRDLFHTCLQFYV